MRSLNPVVRFLAGQIRVDAFGLDVLLGDSVYMSGGDDKANNETPIPAVVGQFLETFNRGE